MCVPTVFIIRGYKVILWTYFFLLNVCQIFLTSYNCFKNNNYLINKVIAINIKPVCYWIKIKVVLKQ